MLQTLRKGASTWVVRIFLGILMVSFGIGIWQGNTLFSSAADTTVATVGDTEISSQAFTVALDREVRRLQQQLGAGFTREQALAFNVQGGVLSQLLSDATVAEAARSFGLRVPDELVAREIAAIPAFQDFTGKFDAARFQAVLRQAQMTEATLTQQIRAELVRAQLYGPAAGGARTPTIVAQTLYAHRNERRVIDYFTLAPAALGPIPQPDEAAIDAYYKANPQAFTAPEFRAITLLIADPAEIAKTTAPTEDAIAAAYEERKGEFGTPEKREIVQMVLKTQAEADTAVSKLNSGGDFVAVAKELANLSEADTKLGTVTKGTLPAALDEAAFAAAEGAIGGPVETPLGWHVFKVVKVEAASVKPMAEVHDTLRDALALDAAQSQITQIQKSLQDELAGGASLEDAGQRLNLSVRKVAAVDAGGKDEAGKPVEGLPEAPPLLPGLFQAATGRNGDMIDTDGGGFVIGRVDTISPAALRPLDQVRGQVIAGWQAAETQDRLGKLAAETVKGINDGKDIAAAAKAAGATPGTVGPGLRSGDAIFVALPPALVTALFEVDKGKAASAPAADETGIIIGAVRGIEAADPAADAEGVKKLAETLREDFAGDLAGVFEADLRARFGISIHEQTYNSLIGQRGRSEQ
ncbi:hypothetical protein D3874_10625 [Oleomonas cavernae]|uniref:Parvulin-like PPIase n=1 Tax=Oleomonas cavernae TaxID=2320859 RepID=A0A418WBL1_9PROT|nr:SurA N-terminal domain-containing protein [Oleomonas cavernae]RJF87421.1 hypothetical protein D3874_10625 [Oleomonas cavernae]